jgi:magnesium-transporting ATPase (P-type)
MLSHALPPKMRAPGADLRVVLGDASDAALLRYADAFAPAERWRRAYPPLHEVPFNSESKIAVAVAAVPEDRAAKHVVFVKGAPERVFARCTHHLTATGEELAVDAAFREAWERAYERFGVLGERVLGFAYRVFPAPAPGAAEASARYRADASLCPLDGLVFAGLVSLVDPPKEGVAEAVAKCRAASIRVTMVTGDHPLTAEAIARKVGIVTLPTAREVAATEGLSESDVPLTDARVRAVVMPGYALPALAEADWDVVLRKEEVVFARTSPQQKLLIVEHYQRLGHVVAVTGDGTNDAPALKCAQIGVSMGSEAASDVAREVADMVLMDDNFASIVLAIEAGRTVFDNLKKCIAYTLAHLLPELLPIFATLAFDVPLMLPGLAILVVDLLTEQMPAASLAFEPPESSVMARPPRDIKACRLLDLPLCVYSYLVVGVAESLVCTLAFFTVFSWYGVPVEFVGFHRELWQSTSPTLVADNGRTFTADQQVTIYRTGVAAYFLTLVLCQAVHVFLAKTRVSSVFTHPIFANRTTLVGVGAALCIASFVIYVPAVNYFFGMTYLNGIWWVREGRVAG